MRKGALKEPSVLGRVLRALDVLASVSDPVTLTELAARAGLPKSTMHRLLGPLETWGAVERSGRHIMLGMRLFELVQIVQRQRFDMRDIAVPFMEDLYEATHEIVNLAVLNGADVVYLDKIGGHRRVDVATRTGGRIPANCTALGKAMLAFSPRHVIERVIAGGLVARTATSITDASQLRRELRSVARHCLAVDRGELEPGVICIAAPVFRHGDVVAAVSITGPARRISVERVGSAVRTAAIGITRQLSR